MTMKTNEKTITIKNIHSKRGKYLLKWRPVLFQKPQHLTSLLLENMLPLTPQARSLSQFFVSTPLTRPFLHLNYKLSRRYHLCKFLLDR